MPFTEDLDAFLDDDDFAYAATFTPTSGSAGTKNVIFDEAYLQSLGVGGGNPQAVGKASDFPDGTTRGGTLLIGSTTYTIQERELMDDGAMVRLQLLA
jgi:hypothetical protein